MPTYAYVERVGEDGQIEYLPVECICRNCGREQVESRGVIYCPECEPEVSAALQREREAEEAADSGEWQREAAAWAETRAWED